MNGYLVVIRCKSEDIPVALVDSCEDAIKIAYKFDPATPDGYQYMDDVTRRIDWPEPSTFVTVSIVEFVEGYPVGTVYHRSFSD